MNNIHLIQYWIIIKKKLTLKILKSRLVNYYIQCSKSIKKPYFISVCGLSLTETLAILTKIIDAISTHKIDGVEINLSCPNIIGKGQLGYDFKQLDLYALIGIGRVRGSKTRYRLYNSLKKNKFILPIIKSKFSYVSPKAQISEGTIIMHGAIINSNVEIGKNCIINTGSIIDHGTTIGNHTHITTGVVINGDVEVGEQNYIGSGSVVHQGIKINDQRIIPSFSRISKNI